MTAQFAAAAAAGEPADLAAQCIAGLSAVDGATLGILYTTEPAAPALPELVRALAEHTGIRSWVGGVGLGVCSATTEIFDQPAAVVMTAALPPEDFRIFAATADPGSDLPRQYASWIEGVQPVLALVHADPRCRDLQKAATDAASASGAYLVGGLLSHRCASPLLALTAGEDAGGSEGIAGLMLAPGVAVATGLTQGCVPVGPVHRVDEARDNVVMVLDGRPALAVFCEDIGPELTADLRRVGGLIFAGLPVAGSDTGDYLVRNLLAIDAGRGWLVLGAEVAAGDPILFCRRDPESARRDMTRMVRQLAGRLSGPPKAGVYVSCVARGAALFGEAGVETGLIRETLGEFPLIGFFANGEIRATGFMGTPAFSPYSPEQPAGQIAVAAMLRLFVGIGFPPELKLRLSSLCSGVDGAKWVDPGNFHLTLRFIGETAEDVAADIDEALARLRARRFTLQLAGTGVFGGGDKPRSLWVGVERCPELVALRDKVEQALVRVGLAPEPRKFSPHVTLARLHKPALDKLAGYLAAHAQFRADPLAVEGFSLIASFQTKAGSVYEDQADYPLLH